MNKRKAISWILIITLGTLTFCGKKEIEPYTHQSQEGWQSAQDIKIRKIKDSSAINIKAWLEHPGSGGKTDGAYLIIPKETSRAFSGKKIKVTFRAMFDPENPSENIWVSYSTFDHGNSGWNQFRLTKNFREYSFEYVVPTAGKSYENYVGFNSDVYGCGLNAIVDKVQIRVIN